MYKNSNENKSTFKKKVGDNGELAVVNLLLSQGYKLLARNYNIHNCGELDSVFMKDDDLYIVEVKSRKANNGYASPEESISPSKYCKLVKTANVFVSKYGLFDCNINFLIGAVTHNSDGLIQNVEIIPF